MVSQLMSKPTSVFCLASGHTPLLAYRIFCVLVKTERIDSSQMTLVGLDEWVGIYPSNPGSCYYFLQHNVIEQLALHPNQVKLFNGLSNDLTSECAHMENFVSERGGIDLMIVGVGMNGHIGFNEPGVDPTLNSHIARLDSKTVEVGQKYFESVTTLDRGITFGIQNLLQSKQAILMANGIHKATIISRTLSGEISEEVPSTFIRQHANAFVLLDNDAASQLNY
jgi:glucosamine-6-phosphate isomerase